MRGGFQVLVSCGARRRDTRRCVHGRRSATAPVATAWGNRPLPLSRASRC